jgi:hypothetical protein
MNLSIGSKSSKASSNSQVDPWDAAEPDIKNVLERLRTAGADHGTVSPGVTDAFNQLKDNAAGGHPFASDISNLASSLFATPDRTGAVGDAYADLERRLTPTADGENLAIENNPYIQRILQSSSDDVMNRTNAMFAGAGRDFSASHVGAVGKNVTNAQLPVLADLFAREQGRTDAAGRDLYAAETGAATTSAGLDASRAALQRAGIDVGQAAVDAQNYGPERQIELENALKALPVDELARLAELVFAAGGLGQQAQGTQTGKQTAMGASARLI